MLKKTLSFLIVMIILSNISSTNKSFLKSKLSNLFQQIDSNVTLAHCFLNLNETVYDLNSLYNSTNDYTMTTTDNGTIDFNICHNALTLCQDRSGLIIYTGADKCLILAGSEENISQMEIISILKYYFR